MAGLSGMEMKTSRMARLELKELMNVRCVTVVISYKLTKKKGHFMECIVQI